MARHLLVAIAAPGSVEARIGRTLAGIFAEHGLASAAALPPLVPVSFLAGAAPRGLLASASRSFDAPWRARTMHAAWVEGSLFLGVSTEGMWAAVRASVLALAPADPQPLFPAAEGFFAGCAEATPAQRGSILPPVPPLSFSSATLVLVAVDSGAERTDWWRAVTWEVLETSPLRGRRKT